jgi:hypothetical protein
MKPGTLLALALSLASVHPSAAAEDPWKTRPELRRLWLIASTMIWNYADWSDENRESGRQPGPADWTVNQMTEEVLLQVHSVLGEIPNSELQRECLLLLGDKVPREFDDIWRMLHLEMDANLDKTVSREVGEILKKKGLPALQDRAMAD